MKNKITLRNLVLGGPPHDVLPTFPGLPGWPVNGASRVTVLVDGANAAIGQVYVQDVPDVTNANINLPNGGVNYGPVNINIPRAFTVPIGVCTCIRLVFRGHAPGTTVSLVEVTAE